MNFFKFNKSDVNKNLLYNKYLLYFIFIISFGNFFLELMKSNMYFVAIYIIIGFLTSFFNKNMIVILSMAVIFANIFNYGNMVTVEGYEDHDDNEENEVDKALGTKSTDDDGIIDELVDQEIKKRKNKKKKNKGQEDEDENEDEDDDNSKKKNKEGLTDLNDKVLDMNYEKAERLLDKQKDILKNLNQYKPFLETIQGIAKNSGLTKTN
jgi:hypothetical protein